MSNPTTIIFLAMVVALLLPLEGIIKTAIIVLLAVVLFFFKRATFLYARSARKILNGKGDAKKNWENLEKATKMGLPEQPLMTAASIFIQKGDYHKGKEILDGYLSQPPKKQMSAKARAQKETWIATAKTMRSMVYWLDGDLDGAIREMKEVHDQGSKNQNVFINYGTYVLEKGDLETARMLIEESSETELHSNGLKDNHGWYCILSGKWKEAEDIYTELHEKKPTFPEAFVHLAQVRIHQGRIDDAIALLEEAQSCKFTQTSGMKLETIKKLHDLLKDGKTRLQTASSIEADPKAVASGKLPTMLQGSWEESEAGNIAPFAQQPEENSVAVQEETHEEEKVEDDEDRLPDTSLDDSDEEYLRTHNFS